ncbi:MAG: MSMEG_0569 family flavin-dependent oxidoreductase [Polyangiaceae bacterium]
MPVARRWNRIRALEATLASLPEAQQAEPVHVVSFTKHAPRDARAKKREHFDVVVVGGGQAGLSVSYLLAERGISHVVLEAQRVAHTWRSERWDSFCLVTPNWQCQLPGHHYAGDDPHGFMLKDEIVRYVESYAERYALPVREGVSVKRVEKMGDSGVFEVETSDSLMTADQVVVATGGYHTQRFPRWAKELPSEVVPVHSAAYRNAGQLPAGQVLVVGTGQSGAQIAEDLLLAGRQVHLCVGSAPRCARKYRGRDVVDWLAEMGHYDVPITQQSNPEDLRERANHYVSGRGGGRDLDLRAFALLGMKLYGPAHALSHGKLRFLPELKRHLDAADDVYRSINRSIDTYVAAQGIAAPPPSVYQSPWEPDSEPVELDLLEAGITSAVFCTGFSTDFGWVKAPVFDERGKPEHLRGVTALSGLYFIGLPWLHTWGSGRFSAVGRDALHIVEHLTSTSDKPRSEAVAFAAAP